MYARKIEDAKRHSVAKKSERAPQPYKKVPVSKFVSEAEKDAVAAFEAIIYDYDESENF